MKHSERDSMAEGAGGKSLEALGRILGGRHPEKIEPSEGFLHAAVMMILKDDPDGPSMLFIKRPESVLDPFSGHMAFPGGKMRESDSSKLNTAIRETLEEIGVDLNIHGMVLGELDDVNPNNPRARGYVVTPFLCALTDEVPLELNIHEVEAAVWVPVSHLTNERNFKIRYRERDGSIFEDYTYSYGPYIIWGMTGRILRNFLSIAEGIF